MRTAKSSRPTDADLNTGAWALVRLLAADELGDGRCHGRLVEAEQCGRCKRILHARRLVAMKDAPMMPERPAPVEPTSEPERQSDR